MNDLSNIKQYMRFFVMLSALVFSGQYVYAAGGVADQPAGVQPVIVAPIAPTFTLANTHHAIAGVALRNRGSGTIHLRGIPARARVVAAYLYWNFADNRAIGRNAATAELNGNRVVGRKVADNPDLCWGTAGTHTYRARATFLLSRRPLNGDYRVTLTLPSAVFTTGENPWLAAGPTTRKVNGAHLVVLYRTAVAAGPTYIYDALSGAANVGAGATYTLTHPALAGPGTYSMAGADGQRGGGNNNGASNEVGTFDGVQFSGPPTAASDWDGSAGLPMPQLYDVHSHDVTLAGLQSVVVYTGGADCWAPTTFVLDQ